MLFMFNSNQFCKWRNIQEIFRNYNIIKFYKNIFPNVTIIYLILKKYEYHRLLYELLILHFDFCVSFVGNCIQAG